MCDTRNTHTTQSYELGDAMGASRVEQRHFRDLRMVAAAVVATLVMGACGGDADDAALRIVPADESVDGQSLTDLVAAYAIANTSATVDESALVDPSRCDMGKSTDAVYLAPTFGAPGEASTTCTVRRGQAVFLTPAGTWCIDDGTGGVDTACLDEAWNLTSSSVTLDGESIDLTGRQVDTEVLTSDLPEGNLWDLPAGPTKVMARGQAVVVENLSVGTHEVVLAADFGNGEFAGSLKLTLVVEE